MFGVSADTLSSVSDIASTVMSTVISVVALGFSQRQSSGWGPLLFSSGHGIRAVPHESVAEISVDVRIVNRRTYPIELHEAVIGIVGVEPVASPSDYDIRHDPFPVGKGLGYAVNQVIAAGGMADFTLNFRYENRPIHVKTPVIISVSFFDPRKGKNLSAKVKLRPFETLRSLHRMHNIFAASKLSEHTVSQSVDPGTGRIDA